MEKFNENEGYWRTIGGRRVFIKNGQSLSDAMKASGKFKNAKRKVDYDKRPQSDVDKENERNNKAVEKIEKGKKDFDPNDFEKWRKEVDPDYEMDDDRARSRYESYKDAYSRNPDKRPIPDDRGGRIDPRTGERFFGKTKEEEKFESIKSQQSDIEKASGLKVKEAFQTDLYGNGKEDRFKLEDGRWISHMTESIGEKEDTWSINKLEKGSIESQDFKSYDDMIKHLGGNSKQKTTTRNDKEYSQKELDNVWKKEDATEVYDYLTNAEKRKLAQAHDDADFGNQSAKDYIKKMDNEAAKRFLENNTPVNKEKTAKYGFNENDAYKKAFEEYKKKHPNSKLNFNQFVDMSEGK